MGAALELSYLACNLRTGAVAEELAALHTTQALGRRLGQPTSSGFELALAGAPREWEAATDPGRTAIVAVDRLTGLPIWSGTVLPRVGGSAAAAAISAATLEAYLDRRYPGDVTVTATDISTIMQQVATPALTQGPPLTLDVTACGTTADYTCLDTDDKSILSCLQELAALAGAPEWTIDTVWADAAQTTVQWILRIRPAIGVQTTSPNVVFDMPGCIADYSLTESYESSKGATLVVARGEANGAARATSDPYTATALLASGWPLWEHRYQPASGINTTDQLNAHAAEALALLQRGSRAWTVQAVASQAPRLGQDWALGDSIGLQIDASPRHPNGTALVARAFGWDLNPSADQVTPILLEGT